MGSVDASDSGDLPFVLKRRLSKLYAALAWGAIGSVFGFVASVAPLGPGPNIAILISVATPIFLVGASCSAFRVKLVVAESEILYVNLIRTWRMGWSEISERGVQYLGIPSAVPRRRPLLSSGRTPPVLGIRSRSRSYTPGVFATLYLPKKDVRRLKAVLEPICARNGIRLRLDENEWSPYITRLLR
jgi:hypothetical protein